MLREPPRRLYVISLLSALSLKTKSSDANILFLLKARRANPATRDIELDIDIGADAKDWSAIQANEKLKPVEAELRKIEEMTAEVVTEMEYLRSREQKLRDTNESTNTRVKWFGVLTTWLLIGLWAWQIMYLRAYFRSKHLI